MKSKQPLKLLFDVSPLVNAQKSGIGYYTERLLIALASKYPEEIKITAHYFNFLGRKNVSLPDFPNIEYQQTTLFPSKLINILRRLGIELPVELFIRKKSDFNIYPNFVGYKSLRRTPSAVAVHDLGYLDCPEYLQAGNRTFLTRYVPRSIKRSRFVITISKATKAAIQRHYGTSDDKFIITPIPPPKTTVTPEKPNSITGKFILFVSTLEPRTNFIGLVQGYMQLPVETRKEFSLVLAGGTGWDVEDDLQEIRVLQEQGEKIVLTGYISEKEKAWLLQNASLFVLPSHYEGFGMPILEAMAVNTPTAVSDIPVFREVSGDASMYFDQKDPEAMAQIILKVLSDPVLQNTLRTSGQARIENMSWDSIAETVYAKIMQNLS